MSFRDIFKIMKKSILLIFLVLTGASSFAQKGPEIKGYFGFSSTIVGPKQEFVGISSGNMKNLKEFGLILSQEIGQKLRLNSGVTYSYSTVEFMPPPCFDCLTYVIFPHESDFKMLSIPVFAEFALGDFFYAAAGPILDFQLSEGNNITDQSGLGYLVGFGGKVNTEKFSFSVFPNYKRHSVIPFENNGNAKDILREFGVQFGVGYRF